MQTASDALAAWLASRWPSCLGADGSAPELARQIVLELVSTGDVEVASEDGGTVDRGISASLVDQSRAWHIRVRPTVASLAGIAAAVCATASAEGAWAASSGYLWMLSALLATDCVQVHKLTEAHGRIFAELCRVRRPPSVSSLAKRLHLHASDPAYLLDLAKLAEWGVIKQDGGKITLCERRLHPIPL